MASTPLVSVRDLTKVYTLGETEVHALNGVSVDIAEGEFVAVMGPSGSGKSTFMNIIGCLDTPTAGSYVLDGEDVARMDARRAGRRAQPQDRLRLPGVQPAAAHLGAGERRAAAALRGDARQAARATAPPAAARARSASPTADTITPTQLSGGQQQRVAIARALVNDPTHDPRRRADRRISTSTTEHEVMALLQELNEERHHHHRRHPRARTSPPICQAPSASATGVT